jgi:hypothetical protein
MTSPVGLVITSWYSSCSRSTVRWTSRHSPVSRCSSSPDFRSCSGFPPCGPRTFVPSTSWIEMWSSSDTRNCRLRLPQRGHVAWPSGSNRSSSGSNSPWQSAHRWLVGTYSLSYGLTYRASSSQLSGARALRTTVPAYSELPLGRPLSSTAWRKFPIVGLNDLPAF